MSIYLVGDTHQSLYNFNLIKSKNKLTKEDIVIVIGDFGFYWNNSIQEHNKRKELAKLPCKICFIDGNHENHELIGKLPIKEMFGNEVGYDEKYGFIHLKRGYSYIIQEKSFLCLGGGHSVDLSIRKEGISWWKQENISTEDILALLKTLEQKQDFDYVLTHTCPMSILKELEKQKLLMHKVPSFWVINHINEEVLEVLKNSITFKYWMFGHFHLNSVFLYGKFQGLYNHYIKLQEE